MAKCEFCGKGVSFGMQRVPTEASESLMDKL
mgnify:CR=1 FL=1